MGGPCRQREWHVQSPEHSESCIPSFGQVWALGSQLGSERGIGWGGLWEPGGEGQRFRESQWQLGEDGSVGSARDKQVQHRHMSNQLTK